MAFIATSWVDGALEFVFGAFIVLFIVVLLIGVLRDLWEGL